MKKLLALGAVAAVLTLSLPASAIEVFTAHLDPTQEVPQNAVTQASKGWGDGYVILNDARDMISAWFSWNDLTAPAVAAHIHIQNPNSQTGPVVFGFMNISGTSGTAMGDFSINAAQIAALEGGKAYFNVHSDGSKGGSPSGEIRGQITQVPEPGTLALMGAGLVGAGLAWRRRNHR